LIAIFIQTVNVGSSKRKDDIVLSAKVIALYS